MFVNSGSIVISLTSSVTCSRQIRRDLEIMLLVLLLRPKIAVLALASKSTVLVAVSHVWILNCQSFAIARVNSRYKYHTSANLYKNPLLLYQLHLYFS